MAPMGNGRAIISRSNGSCRVEHVRHLHRFGSVSVHELLNQIEEAIDRGLYLPALYAVLTVPDICGALGQRRGGASQEAYERWFDDEVGSKYRAVVGPDLSVFPAFMGPLIDQMSPEIREISGKEVVFLSGQDCYRYRCSVLHQARSTLHGGTAGYKRIMFVRSETDSPRRCSRVNDAIVINVVTFCRDIVEAARAWIARKEGTQPFDSNWSRLLKNRPEGSGIMYPPYTVVH